MLGGSNATVFGTTIQGNLARGGNSGGYGGSAGHGVGGGVYAVGTISFDPDTVVNSNHATTSDPNIFLAPVGGMPV